MPIDWYLSKYPNAKATTGKSARVAVSNYAKEKWRNTCALAAHVEDKENTAFINGEKPGAWNLKTLCHSLWL